ncbi:BZ3500_MvSof-1268-A1-R1_Chr1-3g02489 [Microbotryum saponariae]|uniref:BZ3500_MvSof-1268-A1-R1_Chr1-3g02489 protein n=1 Tax=Microbotryum saponariae TaxID=289078 RepID=A0A2X0KJ62_9BASI|nr:BZ3500_MvSof-1268-A1-R1_Chr1-3g02489 [Microbotryum saponariae]SCZ96382.1 BZ3501_MvSof-1269-A2-R1_Chr1-3g02092 [Microbotryum saponariae]
MKTRSSGADEVTQEVADSTELQSWPPSPEIEARPDNHNLDRDDEITSKKRSSGLHTPSTPGDVTPSPMELESMHISQHHFSTSTSTLGLQRQSAAPSSLGQLPEADRSPEAYRFLFVAFIVETVIWGLPSAYGVFLSYYMEEGVHGSTVGARLLPLVGACASGTMYLLGPPVALLLNPYPRFRILAIRIGCCILVLALLLSSFAKTAWQLLLTQGFMYSIGGSLAYYATFTFLSEWFVQRRGFANGVCFAGTALGGVLYPFALEALLSKYGSATTLRALSVLTAVLLGGSMPWLRPRIPVGKGSKGKAKNDPASNEATKRRRMSLWRNTKLWVFMFANIAQAFGFFVPTLYLPTFATSIGLSNKVGSATLACVNASSVFARVYLGILSDRISPHVIGAITLAASALSVFILWGVTSTSLAPLLIFSLVLGVACGGWTSLYAAVIRNAARDDPNLSTTLFGLISFTRGLGSILTAPISSLLLAHPLHHVKASVGFGVEGGKYGGLVIFAGMSLVVAAASELFILL